MLDGLYRIAGSVLFLLPPEQAHEASLLALEAGLYPRPSAPDDSRLKVNLWGLTFPNPIGVAAGYDKDARVPDALLGLGCGFSEVGTITPLPQPGNPAPRLFRLIRDRAVINRLGFNSGGHAAAASRLSQRTRGGIVGVNIGANKDSADRTEDYVKGVHAFAGLASYYMANISSPNTPGLRDLQAPDTLARLLDRLAAARESATPSGTARPPIIVKLSADIAEEDLAPITAVLASRGADGIAVSNTTVTRPLLREVEIGREPGGLSGRPLFHRSTVLLARVHELTAGRIPLIGLGGVESGETALAKIEAGASLVQLYTGLIFEGPGLIERIKRHLLLATHQAGAASIAELKGQQAGAWAAKSFDA
jgi:dihydroorotate dehydrogenase